jgi:hypothetical protein
MSRTLHPPVARLVAPGLALAVVAAGVTACGRSIAASGPQPAPSTSSAPASQASATPPASASPAGHDHTAMAAAAVSSGSPTAAPGSADEGAAAGVRLQALLGQHTVLAADMMRARIRRDPDFAQAAEGALTRNTQALGTLVGSVFGADAAATFSRAWSGHVTHLFEYADALQSGNVAGQQQARQQLQEAEWALGSFFAGASKGRLTAANAKAGMRMHVDGLLGQADAYAKSDYATADAAYQHGFQHTFAFGGTLASALLPKKDAAALAAPGWQLRANLTEALGEHVALIVAAMRAVSGTASGDFKGLGAALNQNTQTLSGAVGTLFGAPAAARFQSLWADHVDALIAVTSGAAAGDTAKQQEGQRQLAAFAPALATFLDTATASRLGADALAQAFGMHDQMLIQEVQAFQAKDYTTAHDLGYRAYDQMFDLSAQLSHAIELTLAKKLPRGGSQTGGGGMAGVVSRR